jgi:hypothetical protein
MNAKKQDMYFCGKCGLRFMDIQDAEKCCTCRTCGKEHQIGDFTGECRQCWHKRDVAKLEKRIAEAEKLETWEGWVCNEGPGGGPQGDGYAESLDALEEYLQDAVNDGELAIEDWPKYVFVCVPVGLRRIFSGDITQMATEESYEDAADNLEGEKELDAALDAFYEKNKDIVSYEIDYKRAVKVSDPEPLPKEDEEEG